MRESSLAATLEPRSEERAPAPGAEQPAESLLAIWGRRAITVPAYLLLAPLYFCAAPLWLLLGVILDLLTANTRLPRTRALIFLALYLGCELTGILGATLLGVFLLGGAIGGAPRFLDANAALQRWFTSALLHGSVRLFSMKLAVEGLELARAGPLLLFVRHSSTADTVLTAALVGNPNRLLMRYVLKRELLWDPCLDIVGRRLPNAFVSRSSARHQPEIAAIARLAIGLDRGSAVLIYPEGTRFSREKLAKGVAQLREKGKEELAAVAEKFQSVLPPRIGGPLALLDAAPEVDVVFVEHTGFEGAATIARFWSGALIGRTIRVRLRRVSAAQIPAQGRDRWLFTEWAETDRWITAAQKLDGLS